MWTEYDFTTWIGSKVPFIVAPTILSYMILGSSATKDTPFTRLTFDQGLPFG